MFLNHPNNKQWRGHLFKALGSWYTKFKPTKKRACKSAGKGSNGVGIDDDRDFIDVNNFEDPLADGPPQAGVAMAAEAMAALAAAAPCH